MGMPTYRQGYRWLFFKQDFKPYDGFGRPNKRFTFRRGHIYIWLFGYVLSYTDWWGKYPLSEEPQPDAWTDLKDFIRTGEWRKHL